MTHDGKSAKVQPVTTYFGHRSIFDDLEVRASDLLQSNCVVWVEGPSDRVYFNKWVDLWSGGELKEHVDYEVCFSGGTLLAHYTFSEPVSDDERIEALKINRNAIVLIDSDKKDCGDEALKARVDRVAREVETMGGIAWITAGKEVENYIPDTVLELLLEKPGIRPKTNFTNIFTLIKSNGKSDYSVRKVELADKVCQALTREMIEGHLDLPSRLDEVCSKIVAWNQREAAG